MQPRLVALDLLMEAPASTRGDDKDLAETIAATRAKGIPVVVGGRLADEGAAFTPPLPEFASSADTGFVDVAVGEDWVVRSVPEGLLVGGEPVYSFAGRVAEKLRATGSRAWLDASRNDHEGAFGDLVPIRFAGTESMRALSFADLVEDRLPPEFFAGKVVLIGRMDEACADFHLLPSRTTTSMRQRVAGVFVQAYCIRTLLGTTRLRHGTLAMDLAMDVGAGVVVVCLLIALGPARGTAAALGLVAVVAIPLSLLLFDSSNYWLNIVPTVLGVVAHGVIEDTKGRRERLRLLEGLVSPAAAFELLRHSHAPLRTAMERDIAVLLVDIAGSSGLASRLGPSALRDLMGTYCEHVSEAAWRHDGFVNQLLGDGVLCLFGALPREKGDPVSRALGAAQDALCPSEGTLERWRQHGAADLRLRAAVAMGPAFVGSVGTAKRFHFTALGDAVNAVFRMIDLPHPAARPYLWVTQDVLDAHDPGWVCVCTHQLALPGHDEPVRVCEMEVPAGPATVGASHGDDANTER